MGVAMRQLRNLVPHDPENGSYGDCHRICFAWILGLAPEEVPHFFRDGPERDTAAQYAEQRAFLRERGLVLGWMLFEGRHGLEPILQTLGQNMPEVPVILGGRSSSGCNHSVVVLNGEIANDPTEAGIVGPIDDGYYHIYFFSPAVPQAILEGAA